MSLTNSTKKHPAADCDEVEQYNLCMFALTTWRYQIQLLDQASEDDPEIPSDFTDISNIVFITRQDDPYTGAEVHNKSITGGGIIIVGSATNGTFEILVPDTEILVAHAGREDYYDIKLHYTTSGDKPLLPMVGIVKTLITATQGI